VDHPPLGGNAGAGIDAAMRLPKDVLVWTAVRSVSVPRFAGYGSWTEDTGSDRVRWSAGLDVYLSYHWKATVTALDILDDGHIEVPGGNAVGFRVVGEIRYTR
jgi:hypothetical protein